MSRDFISAIKDGNLEQVRKLMQKGEWVNQTEGNYGPTALYIACEKGHLDIVKLLIEKKANINAASSSHTALGIACENNHIEIVRFLIEKKADIKETGLRGQTPLNIACDKGFYEIAELLININKDAAALDEALFRAVDSGHYEIVKLLLNKSANVNTQGWKFDEYATPLHLAIERDNRRLVKLLIKYGADTNQCYRVYTPIALACSKEKIKVAEYLICHSLLHNPTQEKSLEVRLKQNFSIFWDKVQKQVQTLKDPIPQLGFSYYELLTKDFDSLALSITVKKLTQLKQINFLEEFPNYSDLLQERLSQLITRFKSISSILSNPGSEQIFSSKNYQPSNNQIFEEILKGIQKTFNAILEILKMKKPENNVQLNEICQREILNYLNAKDLKSIQEAFVVKPEQTTAFRLLNCLKPGTKTNNPTQNQHPRCSNNQLEPKTQTLLESRPRF